MAEAAAQRAARNSAIAALVVSGERPLLFPPGSVAGDSEAWVLLHRSSLRPGWWQASRFVGAEPVGHLDGDVWAALLERLSRDYFVQLSAAQVAEPPAPLTFAA